MVAEGDVIIYEEDWARNSIFYSVLTVAVLSIVRSLFQSYFLHIPLCWIFRNDLVA